MKPAFFAPEGGLLACSLPVTDIYDNDPQAASRLPPEFSRSERFDGIFFVDLPGVAQRRTIWRMHIEKFGLDSAAKFPARPWHLSSLGMAGERPVAIFGHSSLSRIRDHNPCQCEAAVSIGSE
jgi:hypothetical protein